MIPATPLLVVIAVRAARIPDVRGSGDLTAEDGLVRAWTPGVGMRFGFLGPPHLTSNNPTKWYAYTLWLRAMFDEADVTPSDPATWRDTWFTRLRALNALSGVRVFLQRPDETTGEFHARWKLAITWID